VPSAQFPGQTDDAANLCTQFAVGRWSWLGIYKFHWLILIFALSASAWFCARTTATAMQMLHCPVAPTHRPLPPMAIKLIARRA